MEEEEYDERETKRTRRTRRSEHDDSQQRQQEEGAGFERRLDEFFEYTKRRDEENRNVMLRILQAVEKIADKLQ